LKIRSFTHKGLKRLYEEGIAKGVPPDAADKLRKMLAFLDDMQNQRNYGHFQYRRCTHVPSTAKSHEL
jgi:hypothetical protein